MFAYWSERAHCPPALRMPLATDEIGGIQLFRQQQPDVVGRQQHLQLRRERFLLLVSSAQGPDPVDHRLEIGGRIVGDRAALRDDLQKLARHLASLLHLERTRLQSML